MSAKFWDKMSKKYDDNIRKHNSLYEKTIDSTKSQLNKSDLVLDFACASGEMSLDIAPSVQQVHGIDVSAKMIELANKKARVRQFDNIKFDQTNVFDQRLKSSSFSAIIAFNIFHLLDDPPKELNRLNQLLAANGLIISQTPCLGESGWLFRSVINVAQKLPFAPTILSLTIAELESLVSSSNFEILETEIRWDKKILVQWIVARKM